MCKNKKCAKYDKLYLFENPLPRQIQICKNICKVIKKTKFYSRKTENVPISILFKKSMPNFFAKIVQSVSFKAFQKVEIQWPEGILNIGLVE